ncbi:MAG TPA: hypothetical protein VIL45_01300 [Thermoplasmata archaeon]
MKAYEEDDPLEFVGVAFDDPEGDAALDAMARAFVEEFARMGWTRERILGLFRNPFYRGPHAVYRRRGEPFITRLIEEVL